MRFIGRKTNDDDENNNDQDVQDVTGEQMGEVVPLHRDTAPVQDITDDDQADEAGPRVQDVIAREVPPGSRSRLTSTCPPMTPTTRWRRW